MLCSIERMLPGRGVVGWAFGLWGLCVGLMVGCGVDGGREVEETRAEVEGEVVEEVADAVQGDGADAELEVPGDAEVEAEVDAEIEGDGDVEGEGDTSGDIVAPALSAPVPTELSGRSWERKGIVRGVFIAPSDRPFAVGLRERLHTLMTLARDFFAAELAREGHRGRDGSALGFELEMADDGLWDVVFLRSEHPASHFHEGEQDAPGAALGEIFARLPEAAHRDAILVYFYDTHLVAGDALQHTGQAGSAAPWMGVDAGYALIGAHVLGVGFDTVSLAAFGHGPSQQELFEDRAASGLSDWDGAQVFGPLSRGSWASTYLGAAIHELGHAFGLEHTFGDEDMDGVENNLMGHGFRRFGGRFTATLPQPPTRLGVVSADALAPHPFLGPR